ncbi:MAG: carboxypeptidase-like regulatory domain-containing protein, partial [Tannerella sp.]|nr:carboxypeptidase-like regulatory domain-containing protein [Tannerella sp.]
MTKKWIDGMKNAKLKKLVKIMMLSAFLLMTGVWTASARGGDSQETPGLQQQSKIRITGTVVDRAGETVIGANIIEKGVAANGTISDIDGKFSLEVNANATLQISYIGYVTQDVAVGTQRDIAITLQEDLQALDEVIVIGYGTARRQDFTGSVASVRLEDSPIALAPNLNALEALKGNVAGLDIGATNSAGGQPSMQLRGQKS